MVLNACIISYGSIGDIDESQNMFRNLKSVDRVYQDYQLVAYGLASSHTTRTFETPWSALLAVGKTG